MTDAWFHGECNIVKIYSLPKGLKVIQSEERGYKIADSEVTGNFHMIKDTEGITMYEKNGVLYLKANTEAEVFCVDKTRHDTIILEPGIYEIEPAKEYDHLSQEVRNVAD